MKRSEELEEVIKKIDDILVDAELTSFECYGILEATKLGVHGTAWEEAKRLKNESREDR